MTTTLLVDFDMLIYRFAFKHETAVEWEPGVFTHTADLDGAWGDAQDYIRELQEAAGADKTVSCVSGAGNFRTALWPAYKAEREGKRRPLLVTPLRERCVSEGGYQRPMLEADDILGILATQPKIIPGKKIVWSLDKDLLQIPGFHLVDGKVCEVSREAADDWHLKQALVGDRVDNYPGCPGVGPKKAEKFLTDGWPGVVRAFTEAGLTEEDALIQARVARILRHTDYNFDKKEVILWKP